MSGPFIKMMAQVVVQGIAVMGKAVISAYHQALASNNIKIFMI